MSTPLSKTKRDDLVLQCMQEYDHDLKYRQKREPTWQEIDDLYYGKKKPSLISRANVHIPKMQGTIDTFVGKIDSSPYIKFKPEEEGDAQEAQALNKFLDRTRNDGDWDLIDVLGKKEAALYGRQTYKKYATSENGYTDYLEPLDILDFLIDPRAGGLDPIAKAQHCGQDNLIKSIYDLKDPNLYDQAAVKRMAKKLTSDRDVDNRYNSHQLRRYSLNLSDAILISQDSIKLIEWYTHFEGEKYYVLFSYECQEAVRVCPLKEVFKHNKFPFVSWALFPRLGEFYTPGLGELTKEPNIIQNVIMSQLLDNNAYRNYGMKAYDQNKVSNPKELTPRPMGKIAVDGNPADAIMDIKFPDIQNAQQAFNLVEVTYSRETGVNTQAKGTPNTKRMSATEFAGLIDEMADRFFTANHTYKTCLRQIGELWLENVAQFMTKDYKMKVLGASGYETVYVSYRTAKLPMEVIISTGIEAEQADLAERDRFTAYREANKDNERINQKFLDEKAAQYAGLEDYEIDRLLHPEYEGDWKSLSEAAQENEWMLKKDIELNKSATLAHVQKHLDFLRTQNNLPPKTYARILAHARDEMPLAQENEDLTIKKFMTNQRKATQTNAPVTGQLPENPAGMPTLPGSPVPVGGGMPTGSMLPVQPPTPINPQ